MRGTAILAGIVVAACTQDPDPVDRNRLAGNVVAQSEAGAAVDPYEQVDNVALPDDRTPLNEPEGPIDPRSAEAAGQVVQSFGALIEQQRWREAEALWRNPRTALAFTAALKRNGESHLEIGRPGELDGAAGSVYVTVPVILYGKNAAGGDFRRGADAVLRRINDVPGATEAQRRWRIERIELKS